MSEKRYFIKNPAGAIHEVAREHAADLLKGVRGPGYRPATAEEVKQYFKPDKRFGKPIQRFDRPIGDPWNPVPEEMDVDAIFEEIAQESGLDQESESESDPKPETKKRTAAKSAKE